MSRPWLLPLIIVLMNGALFFGLLTDRTQRDQLSLHWDVIVALLERIEQLEAKL